MYFGHLYMHRRQVFMAGITGALPLATGCIGQFGFSDNVSCPETTTISGDDIVYEHDPVRKWQLGERIEDPEPFYRPRAVAVANFDMERDVSILVTRDDVDGAVFDRTVTIEAKEYVSVVLLEPDVWTVKVTLPSGATKTHTVTRFDCNSYLHGIAARCGSQFTVFGSKSLVACPKYPVNESESENGSEPPGTSTTAGVDSLPQGRV